MLADQMIFTACGKDKKGSFTLWSKSQSVTSHEYEEIMSVMNYVLPQNSPPFATDEEIKNTDVYPQRYGYFGLSTGRVCVARSVYVGKVYNIPDEYGGIDNRYGNVFVHAYIFNDIPDDSFDPFAIFGSDIFKSGLTYKEWHDDPVPEYLPSVELNLKSNFDPGKISEYGKVIPSLIQSALEVLQIGKTLSFNIGRDKTGEIYSIIGGLLPRSINRKLFFITECYDLTIENTLSQMGMQPIVIKNIFVDNLSTFNYPNRLRFGEYVFDFDNGILKDVPAGEYVSDILNVAAKSDVNAVSKEVNGVSDIMQTANCGIDEAVEAYYLQNSEVNFIKELPAFLNALNIVSKGDKADKKQLSDKIFNDIIKTKKFGVGKDILPLIKYVYDNADQGRKRYFLEQYLREYGIYGVDGSLPPKEFAQKMKECAPFAWEDMRKFLLEPASEKYITGNYNANAAYLFLDVATDALLSGTDEEKGVASKYLDEIMKAAYLKCDYDRLMVYKSRVMALGKEKILSVWRDLFEKNDSVLSNPEFVIGFILACDSETERVNMLTSYLKKAIGISGFMPLYIKYSEKEPALFKKAEESLSSDDKFAEFICRKDVYIFSKATDITANRLNEFFAKYVAKGRFSTEYTAQLQKYLQAVSAKSAKVVLDECLGFYRKIKSSATGELKPGNIYSVIEKTIYNIPIDELLKIAEKYQSELDELGKDLAVFGIKESANKATLSFVLSLQQDKASPVDIFENLSEEQVKKIFDKYFDKISDYYYRARKKASDKIALERAVFMTPMRIGFIDVFASIEKLSYKKYIAIISDMLADAVKEQDDYSRRLVKDLKKHIFDKKKCEVKKIEKELMSISDGDTLKAVADWFEKYFEEHQSFFEKLFKKKK